MKGLEAQQVGNRSFSATALEIYAEAVWERVGEVDNCLDAMRIAIEEISNLGKPSPGATAAVLYRYHYENYLLRLSGLLDRAHRLVGVVVGLSSSKLNSNRTNATVLTAVEKRHPKVHNSLLKLRAVQADKAQLRNSVAHATAYSTRELGLFTAAERLPKSPLDRTHIKGMMQAHFTTEVGWLGVLAVQSEAAIFLLLDELTPIICNRASAA
jgi:hypothetical protein